MRAKEFLVLVEIILLCALFKACQAQLPYGGIRRVPAHGSVSKANSNAFEREYNLANGVAFSQGVSNSRVVTKSNGGARNGGITSAARSKTISRELNVGGLDIGGSVTRSQTRTNGATSRGVQYDFNVGNVGLGASFSPTNLQNGFGLQRQPDGSVSLGLGLLNLDLNRNTNQGNQALTEAQVNAQGRNARTRAHSNSQTNTQQYGGLGVTTTQSHSAAVGRTRVGQTNANTASLSGNIYPQNIASYRPRRQLFRPRRDVYYNSEPYTQLQGHSFSAAIQPSILPNNDPILATQQNQSLTHSDQFSRTNQANNLRYSKVPYTIESADHSTELNDLPPPMIVEQFDMVDETQQKARTFSFITDFVNSLLPCVYPCTKEAYNQNRCCVIVPQPTSCCNTPPIQPLFPRPPLVRPLSPSGPVLLPPINCCTRCEGYGYYGPPPCNNYNWVNGDRWGVGGVFSSSSSNAGSTLTNFGTNVVSNTGQTLSVFVPNTYAFG